jgi:hypothetical protein
VDARKRGVVEYISSIEREFRADERKMFAKELAKLPSDERDRLILSLAIGD